MQFEKNVGQVFPFSCEKKTPRTSDLFNLKLKKPKLKEILLPVVNGKFVVFCEGIVDSLINFMFNWRKKFRKLKLGFYSAFCILMSCVSGKIHLKKSSRMYILQVISTNNKLQKPGY